MATVRTLYESPLLRIGEFHCRGGDPRWRACNSIGEGHHLVFPRTAVFIAHEGGEAVLADPSVAVVHRSHERYRRAIADPAGDHRVWVVPNVALARSLERLDDERPVPRFVRTGRRAYATQTLVAWTLARGGPIDPMVVEEEMLGVVADALGRVEETPPSPTRAASRDEAVEQVRPSSQAGMPSGRRWARSRGRSRLAVSPHPQVSRAHRAVSAPVPERNSPAAFATDGRRSISGSPAGASGCRPWPDGCGESGSRTRGIGRRAGGRPGSSSPSPVPAASGCSTSAAAGRGGSPQVLRRMGL